MRSEWRDPDDVTPGARRTPRMVAGWRSYDPLRRMLVHPSSGITADHIMAADIVREAVDLAALGYSGDRPLIYVAQSAAPRWGMTKADVARLAADRVVRRVLRIFPASQLMMLEAIVLRNMTLRDWVKTRPPLTNPAVEKGRLLSILDQLVQHFISEIEDDVVSGRRLPP